MSGISEESNIFAVNIIRIKRMKTYNEVKGMLALLCIILLCGSCSSRVQEDLVMLVGTYTDV